MHIYLSMFALIHVCKYIYVYLNVFMYTGFNIYVRINQGM